MDLINNLSIGFSAAFTLQNFKEPIEITPMPCW